MSNRTIKRMKRPDLINLVEKVVSIIGDVEKKYETVNLNSEHIDKEKEKINEFFKYLFDDSEDNISLVKRVKSNIDNISEFYSDYFVDKEINELCQRINNFDLEYFSEQNDENSKKQKIDDFYNSIFSENGLKFKMKELLEDYNFFYGDEKTMDALKKDQKFIDNFNNDLEKNIKPNIITAEKEINALLSIGTGNSLLDGYLSSKREYKDIPVYRKLLFKKGSMLSNLAILLYTFLYNSCLWLLSILFKTLDYVFFVLPLIIAVVIFTRPDIIQIVFNQSNLVKPFSELGLGSRLVISIPMWWISWFGQRNIMHKKRISEEYNHKSQVVKMYMHFSSKEIDSKYPISEQTRSSIESKLVEVIFRNPAEVYKSDMTMIDRISNIIGSNKFSDNKIINIESDSIAKRKDV